MVEPKVFLFAIADESCSVSCVNFNYEMLQGTSFGFFAMVKDRICGASFIMRWLSTTSESSNLIVSAGQYHATLGEDRVFDPSTTSMDTQFHYNDEELDRATALSIAEQEQRKWNATGPNLKEDEELARALQASMNLDSLWANDNTHQPPPFPFLTGLRLCAGCNNEIGHHRFLNCMGALWHPECFRCYYCNQPIYEMEFSMSGNYPYHKSCYQECHHPKCDVCKQFIPVNGVGMVEFRAHPFWGQKYCPSHEFDNTPRCCSCEHMEPRNVQYVSLGDGRKLCLECLHFSIMDTSECQPLFLDIREFYEGLNMKVGQQIPLLLVERQALNEAMEGEKQGHHLPETRGLCLSEEQTVSTIRRGPKIGRGNSIINMITEPYRLSRHCEVTAILILYGLPRLLTGSILAHEMMHAWLRLNGYRSLRQDVEEGICQVLAHMWLESEIMSGSGNSSGSTSSASSSSATSKKGTRTPFERKLGEFFIHQIESDPSPTYGGGFRAGNRAVLQYGLKRTLDHIRLTGMFP
ncbi:protein DA1-like isoform X3 [Nymphaea colorata]|uniref:protein DA1-like isoform X3 n=2 Tax=Nymphaea colorata TaxID=210225 RepID=UPI00129E6610|nr:protein DA1-like isoform X3 [Nymphaea colorata]